jgi:hypothetical protein
MRVLLDENLPKKLKYRLAPDHEASTVPEVGWSGLLNGALLRAAENEFDAFITLDRGIRYQQRIDELDLRVIVLKAVSNKYDDLLPLVPSIAVALSQAQPGVIYEVSG